MSQIVAGCHYSITYGMLCNAAQSAKLKTTTRSFILTGWQRYFYKAPLCELFPSSVPSLVLSLLYLQDSNSNTIQLKHRTKALLNCSSEFSGCHFPGSDVHLQIQRLAKCQGPFDWLLDSTYRNTIWKKFRAYASVFFNLRSKNGIAKAIHCFEGVAPDLRFVLYLLAVRTYTTKNA